MTIRRKSFSVSQIKVGDIIRISEPGLANQPPHARFVVTGKRKGMVGYVFALGKISGETYRYSWDFRAWWTAKELSKHYAEVFRAGKPIGNVVTRYW